MTYKVFPDNTVLCNFGSVHRLDLLRDWLRDRGCWTEAVEAEARESAVIIPGMEMLFEEGWLGDSIAPKTQSEEDAVLRLRRVVFGGRDDQPKKHLGEAMTLVLIRERPELKGSWWITDDADAADFARHQGITTRDTYDIMCELVADGSVGVGDAFALMMTMLDRDRHLRVPSRPDELLA